MNLNSYYPTGPFGLHSGDIGVSLQPHHQSQHHHMHNLHLNGFHHGIPRSNGDDGFQLPSPGGYGTGRTSSSSVAPVGAGFDLTTSAMSAHQHQRRPSSLHSDTVDGSVVDGLEMSSPPPTRECVSDRYRSGGADSLVAGGTSLNYGIGLQQQQHHHQQQLLSPGNGIINQQRHQGIGIDHRAVAAAAAAAAAAHHQHQQHHQLQHHQQQQQQHCWSMSSGALSGDDSQSPPPPMHGPFGTAATGGPATPGLGRGGCCGGGGAGPEDCSPTGGLMCVTDQHSPTTGASAVGGGGSFGSCSSSSGSHVPFYPWMGVVGELIEQFVLFLYLSWMWLSDVYNTLCFINSPIIATISLYRNGQ